MLKKRFFWGSFFLFVFIFFLGQAPVEAVIVRINQPKIRLSIPPGGNKTGTIEIENPSVDTIRVKAYLEDWVYVKQDGSKEFKPPGTLPLSCAKWIDFAPAEFNLSPRGKIVVNYTVNVPAGSRGGHYAVLFFETSLSEAKTEEGVAVNVLGRIGSLFYIEPAGTIKKAAKIYDLNLNRKDKNLPLQIKAKFKNMGNVDITATGTFNIIDKSGMVFGRGKFEDVYTFPDDEAEILADCKEVIPRGIYDLVITLDLSGSPYIKETEFEIGANGEVLRVWAKD